WGGEEFLLFLPATTPAEAQTCIQRLRDAVAQHPWFRIHPHLSVTFSAGIAAHDWQASVDVTLNRADQALYEAKAQGRDQVCEAQPGLTAQAQAPIVSILAPTQAEPPPRAGDLDNGWLLSRSPSAVPTHKDHWFQQWVFGHDESLRPWIQRCLIASGIYVSLILAIVAYGVPSGLVSPRWAKVFVSADLLAAIVPLLVVRSGLAKKWNDPGLTLVQILWGCALCTLAFLTVPHSRAYDIQLLCVTLVFGLNHLKPIQAVLAGGFASIMFMIIYLIQTHAAMAAADDLALRLQLLMAATIIWLLTLQMRHHCNIREGVNQEKRRLLTAMEQLRQAIKFDPLTQLYNRPHMNSLLEDESLRHDRTGSGFCVALIDLDHFKAINDQLGHQAGDGVLKRFSACAKQVLRETDTIGRWGGEEFVLLVPDIGSVAQGFKAVERLREMVQSQVLCKDDPARRVTFSAGLAIRQAGEPIAALLERADSALYAAKQQGRNRCIISQA
ncbi:MAG: GGDEF domain-containing protein, partial [Burkholderiales bacterium]|nr:GGDEF domain-containing protein [Burkholderiales bacterium]